MGTQEPITREAETAEPVSATTLRVRALNDALRTSLKGGTVFMTRGIDALSERDRDAIITAVRTFDAFTEDNDPYGQHDCATLIVAGHHAMFKIDYYDRDMEHGSPDASDPSITARVLTILLTHEY
jgi:Protein of unknown function (DUF3768)